MEEYIFYNFTELFNKEFKSASRGNYPLSLLMMELAPGFDASVGISDTKDLIDTFQIIVKLKLREVDTVFKYDADRLFVFLPFTDAKGSDTVSLKINEAFLNSAVMKQKNKGFRLAIAHVTFPDDGRIGNKLLENLEMLLQEDIRCLNEDINKR